MYPTEVHFQNASIIKDFPVCYSSYAVNLVYLSMKARTKIAIIGADASAFHLYAIFLHQIQRPL